MGRWRQEHLGKQRRIYFHFLFVFFPDLDWLICVSYAMPFKYCTLIILRSFCRFILSCGLEKQLLTFHWSCWSLFWKHTDLWRLPADSACCAVLFLLSVRHVLSFSLTLSHSHKYGVVRHWNQLWSCWVLCGEEQRTTVARKRLWRMLPVSPLPTRVIFFPLTRFQSSSLRLLSVLQVSFVVVDAEKSGVWCCFSSMGRKRPS